MTKFKSVLIGLLIVALLIGGIFQLFPSITTGWNDGVVGSDLATVGEVASLRTETSKTYYLGNGQYQAEISSGIVHYKDNYDDPSEQWEDIDLSWDGSYLDTAPYILSVTGNNVSFTDKKTGDYIVISPLRIGVGEASLNDIEIVPFNGGVRLQRQIPSTKDSLTAEFAIDVKGGSVRILPSAVDNSGNSLPVEYSLKEGILTETVLLTAENVKFPITVDPTIYIYSSTSDGYIYKTSTSYSTCWGGATGSVVDDENNMQVGQRYFLQIYSIRRMFLFFDTSSIREGSNIISASIGLCGQNDASGSGFDIVVQKGTSETYPHDPLEEGDYAKGNYEGDLGSLNTYELNIESYNIINLNADGKSWINMGGLTKFCLRSWLDIDYWPPSGVQYVIVYSAEVADKEPYLYVLYYSTPRVITEACTDIHHNSLTANGDITDAGGYYLLERGFCYIEGAEGTPTTADSKVHDHIDITAPYSLPITGLTTGTSYRVRAYAINYLGTGYGTTVDVTTTAAHIPVVDTDACSDIASTTMEGNADITDYGGATVTRRGFVYAEELKYALDFNGISDYVEIPYLADYYSNTAAVETFEWGSDTDPLSDDGGSIDWTISVAGTSKAEIDTAQHYLGTRSARLYRDGTNPPSAYFPQSPVASTQVISVWVRKDETSRLLLYHGDGVSKLISTSIGDDERIGYRDSENTWIWLTDTVVVGTWHHFEIKNANWVAGTFDIYLDGSLIKSGAEMSPLSSYGNVVRFWNYTGTSDVWLDNILVGSPSVWTFETWINRKADNAAYERLLSYSANSDFDRFFQISTTDTVQSGFKDTAGTQRYVGTTDTIPLNTDVHLATTFDGTYIKIYINGILKATSASFAGKIPRNNNLAVWLGRVLTLYNFNGDIDEVRIWEDVRTQDEIQANMYAELDGDEAGLVGYWKLNEGTLTTAGDSTANANDGTITGADWVYQSWDLKTMEDDVEQAAYDSYEYLSSGWATRIGQKLPVLNGYIDSLSFYLLKAGSPTGDITFTVRDLDDNILATKVWGDASSLTTSPVLKEATFTSPIFVNEWGRILVEYSGGDSANYVKVACQDGSLTPIGYFTVYIGAWVDYTAYDVAYILGYTPVTYEDGSFGEGEYNLTIKDLTPATWWRVRGFAVNSEGIGYGDVVVAETLTILLPPTNLAATDGAYTDKVVLTWTKSYTATGYKVYENGNLLDTVGDVATWDDATAPAPTIIAGTATASDGSSTLYVILTLTGESANNGTSRTYKATALRGAEESGYSNTDEGYRTVGALTFQWKRSATDSDDNYSNIIGATSVSYNDTAAPAPTITAGTALASDGTSTLYVVLNITGESGNDGAGRWFQCVLNAEGAVEQTSTSDRGYRGTTTLTLEWFRSTADLDANFSSIAGEGGTTNPFNDYNGALDPDGRYYYAEISMVGAITQTTTHDRGYILVVILLPPTNLVAIQTGLDSMNVTWSMGAYADYTILRIKVDEYPSDITDGEELYYGNFTSTAYNLTYIGVDLMDVEIYNLDNRTYYIRAWSENGDGYSIGHAETTIGGKMIIFIVYGFLALGLTYGFYWKKSGFFAYGAAGMWALLGFQSLQTSASASPIAITDTYMGLFWLCIVFTIACALLPTVMREKPSADDIYVDEVDELSKPFSESLREDAKGPREHKPRRKLSLFAKKGTGK